MEHLLSSLFGAAQVVVPFLVVLGIVVFVHELGHFWVARRCGVKVETFSIGFGPEIFHWHDRRGTRWRVAWLPLGGYVKMFGDADPSSFGPGEHATALTEEEKKSAFYAQKVSKRFLIVAAGPAANYLFAAVVLATLYLFAGQSYTAPVVGAVLEDSAAAQAGLQTGDEVLSIDGRKIESFEDIRRTIALNVGTPAKLLLQRDGARLEVTITPKVVRQTDRLGGEHMKGLLGISSDNVAFRQLGPVAALRESVKEVWNITAGTLRGVWQMIVGVRGTEELGGPLRIAEMSGKVAKDGFFPFVWFIVVLSVNLGLINLFPVPLLDGGHLLFYALEAIRGRPLGEKVQEIGAGFGALLVLSLMLFSTWNDLVHLRVISYLHGLFS